MMENDVEKKHAKMRPPLNRAIPPIPESKSNDSIITHILEKHTETHTELEPSTSQVLREPSCVKSIGELVASFTAKMSSQKIESDGSLVIENTMAHSLVTKTAVIISKRNGRSEDMPRSPLISVAHSVRSKLTKLGSRFSRSDENQNIRTSTSLSSIRRGPVDKLSCITSNPQFKKSASMETRTNQNSTKDSVEFVPSRQILGTSALRIPSIPKSRTSLNDQETSKKNVLSNHDKYSKLIKPKDLPSKSENDMETSSIVKAFKVHLEPRTTQTVSLPNRIRQLSSPAVAFTLMTEVHASKNQENIKEAKSKHTMDIFVGTNTERDAYLTSSVRSQYNKNDSKNDEQMKARNTVRKRSFIPLYTTLSRRLSARKSGTEAGQAPLAECESSCIENSPAVEVPPVKFTLDKNYSCTEERWKNEIEGSQSLDLNSSINSVREACSNQFLKNESTHNCGKTTRKRSFNDKRKNGYTTINLRLSDNITNNLPNISAPNCSCDNDLKSKNSSGDFVSPVTMTSSGFTTSSGFQDSPDKSPVDGELNEQFVDKTITQKANRSRSRRRLSRDLDQEQIASSSPISAHYKNQRYDKALVNENKAVAFPSIAMYESSCNDVVYIKNQLLELRRLINDSAEVESMNKSTLVKIEDSDVIQRLLKENDALRKELVEKDRIISKLMTQMLLH